MDFIFEKSRIIAAFATIVKSSNEYLVMSFINRSWYVHPPNAAPTYPPTPDPDNTTVIITLTDEHDIARFYKCMGESIHILKVDIDFVIEFNDTIRSNKIEIITASSGERYAIIDKSLESETLIMKLSSR